MLVTGVVLGTGLLSALLYWGYAHTFDIQVTHTRIELAGLPAEFDGYRIALISCIHTDSFGLRERILRDKLRGLDADLLVIAGDFRRKGCAASDTLASCRKIFEGLSFPDGMVACKGNHDRRGMFAGLEEIGIRVLFNQCYSVHRDRLGPAEGSSTDGSEGSVALTFVGVGPARYHDPDWLAALRQARAPGLRIGLCHSPDGVVSASRHPIALLLCGHTHGGQVCVPGLGPLVTETRLVGPEFASGLVGYEDTLVYVNRGIGWTSLPVRFRCPPEISMLTLRRVPEPVGVGPHQETAPARRDKIGS